jgi:hypothetical protein
MKLPALSCVLCFLLPLSVSATTLPRQSVNDLYHEADVVAIIQIESGSVVKNGEHECGVKYRGRLLEPIKGPFKSNDVIEFGPFSGYGVGNQALVFLDDSTKVYDPKVSTNSSAMAQEAEYKKTCLPFMPKYSIMFSGFGFLEISWTTKFDYKDAVLFKDEWVASPDGLEKKLHERGDNRIESTEYWVKVADVVTYLKNIGIDKAANP